ncbi:MAG: hypothetical protein ACREL7_06030 [Longimicrobiales bacterium]
MFDDPTPVSAKSLEKWLKEAERRAGVPHVFRRGWHGIRRLWTDYTLDEEGLDTVVASAAWSDDEMPRNVYAEKLRLQAFERARGAPERKRPDMFS